MSFWPSSARRPALGLPSLTMLAVAAATVVAGAAGYAGARTFDGAPATPAGPAPAAVLRVGTVPASPAIEATYGVRFSRIGVIADGGLVDVRFQVLDPDRAQPLLGHHGKVAMVLKDERGNVILDTRAMTPGESTLRPGETYFILFRNAANSVHRGDRVDVLIAGGLHLDGLLAE